MIWFLAVAVTAVLFLIFINRPKRLTLALVSAAERARGRGDWTAAAKFFRHSYETAGLLKEPLKSKMECQIEIRWADVLYRQGRIGEAEDMVRRGLVTARRHFSNEAGMLPRGSLTWGDLCTDERRHGEAEQHYRNALEGEEGRGNLAGAIFALQRLSDSLICQGRRSQAEEAIHRAIEIETQVVHEGMLRAGKNPAEHPVISMCQPDLYFCREQHEDARRLYREKVAFWERQGTHSDTIDLGRLQMRLARAEALTGHLPDAIEMYTRAEATFQREWCVGHPKAVAAREAKAVLRSTVTEARQAF